MNAWPALKTIIYDGWVIRISDGVTRRANTVNPLYESGIDIEKKMKYCEEIYSFRKLPVIFKMTSDVFPPDLDDILESKNYNKDAETSVQTIQTNGFNDIDSQTVILNEKLNNDWLNRFIKFNHYDRSKTEGFGNMLKQIIFKRCFLDLIIEGNYAGCGLGVLEDSFVGIFDIVVNPDHRRRGHGRKIVESLIAWGRENGAATAYLQVMLNNQPALKLYEKIGFKEQYKYWYRIKAK